MPAKNGMGRADKAKNRPDKGILAGSPLEAESLYKSPYFPESYDFPYNPDPLCSGNNYDIYDEMRDDDQVKVAINIKKDLVVNSGWVIECEDKNIVEEVTNGLKDMEANGRLDMAFEDILRGIISSGYEFGFVLSEPVWRLEGSKYQYDTLKVRPPHTFRFNLDDFGNVSTIVQSTARGDLSFQPEKFIHYAYQSDFGNPYGRSDLRAAYGAWKAKKFINKFLAIYLERYAGPTVVGKFPSGWDSDQVSRLHTILQTIQNKTVLAIPDDVMVEFVQANRDASAVYIQALNYYNMMIGRSILIPDLAGVTGEKTSGGSYSLGSEQFRMFMATIEKDRQALSRKITLRLVRPLVRANYGDIPCEFKFLPYTSDSNTEFLKIWSDAVKGNVFKPNDEEVNHLRKQLKFPEGNVDRPDPIQVNPFPETNNDLEPKPKKARPMEAKSSKDFKYRRDFTLYERKVDFSKVQETLERSSESAIPELTRILERIARDLFQQAKDKKILDKFRPEKIADLKTKYRKELNDALRGHFVSLFRKGVENAKAELRLQEKKFVENDILPEEFENIIRAEAFKLTGDMSEDVRKRVSNKMFEGVKNGLPASEVGESIFSDLKKYTDNQLKTIVHTKTTEVFNAARKTFFDSDPIASRLITGYQYSAIIDETTTEVCRYLDQKVFDKEDADYIARITPPLHWNCRSLLVPVTSFEDPEFDRTVKVEKLEGMGANLLSKDSHFKSFASGEDMPGQPKTATWRFSNIGDYKLLEGYGPGAHIKILKISAYNSHPWNQVRIGFRTNLDYGDLHYVSMLDRKDGRYEVDFGQSGWVLPENLPLVIRLDSSDADLSITIRYEVVYSPGNTQTSTWQFTNIGDYKLVDGYGTGKFIKLLKIFAYNSHAWNQVNIGFKSTMENAVLNYGSTLERQGGRYDIDFGQIGWILPENSPLVMRIDSSDAEVSVTAKWEVVDADGRPTGYQLPDVDIKAGPDLQKISDKISGEATGG